MRFGMFVPQGWRLDLAGIDPAEHWNTMRGLAQWADASGYDSVWVYDHLHTTPVPTEEATHEAWTLMAALAATTSRVKLGQMCTCMGYRNPAYLAKVAATIDVISGGRVQMGIGAGWYEHEWRAYGYGFPPAGERLAMLDEGVQIMHQAWTRGQASLDGKHYRVDGAIVRPLPLQATGGTPASGGVAAGGGIPLWIAGGGERKTLRIAAQYASYTNFSGGRLEEFGHKRAVLAEHCRAIGRDPAEIGCSTNYNVILGETAADVTERVDWQRAHFAPLLDPARVDRQVDTARNEPLVGTVEQVTERLVEARAAGVDYAITYFADAAYDRTGLELFANKVIPELG